MNPRRVIVKIIIMFLIGAFLTAGCSFNTPKWSLVWSDSEYVWKLYPSPIDENILVGVFSETIEIYYLEFTETEVTTKKLEFMDNQQPLNACLGLQEAWVVLTNGQVLHVDLESQDTQVLSELENFGEAVQCFVSDDGNLNVYGRNWMARNLNGVWKSLPLPEDTPLQDMTYDGDNLWLLYSRGQLYRLDQEEWTLMGTLNVESKGYPYELAVIDNVAWIATFYKLYQWDFSEEGRNVELVVNFNEDNRNALAGFDKDREGGLWLMTYNKIWHGINGIFEEINIPESIGSFEGLRVGGLAKKTNRLYVASLEGVFCLNASDIQSPCFMPPK